MVIPERAEPGIEVSVTIDYLKADNGSGNIYVLLYICKASEYLPIV